MQPAIEEYSEYPTFKVFLDAFIGPRNAAEEEDKCNKELQWTDDFECSYSPPESGLRRDRYVHSPIDLDPRQMFGRNRYRKSADPVCIDECAWSGL